MSGSMVDESIGVGLASAPSGQFVVLDSTELVILPLQIGFEESCGGQESENGHVSLGKVVCLGAAICFFGQGITIK
jgi:hypothetical protein